jgi:nucleolin
MSSTRKGSSRESGKKGNELRISEDFYARMESDVKSLVKQMRPGTSASNRVDHEHKEQSLFTSAPKEQEGKDRKRKRSDISSSENRQEESHNNDEQHKKKREKKANPTVQTSNRGSSSSASPAPSASQASNATSHHYANEKTVYVSGLPFTCTEEDIREFFKDIGTIKSIRLPRWHDSGKLRGYGHVEFNTKAAADSAMELSGQYIKGRYVNVDHPMVPRAAQAGPGATSEQAVVASKPHPPGCRTIFIKNLPYDVTEEEIRQHFMVYGPITNIRLAGWNHTQNLKGFGYIEYKREDSTEIAVKKNGTIVIRDRRIVVDYETAAPKGSYRDPTKPASKKLGNSSS